MNDIDFTEGPLKDVMDAGKLHDFFLVNAPAIEGKFYHDAQDNPIDCNIYHPKYGYDGHVADSYQFTITSYSPTVYEDPKTHKTIWCRHFLEVLCIHEDGTYTNKDGEKVIIISRSLNQQRLAVLGNFDDYKEIYDRELFRKGLADKIHDAKIFNEALSNHIQYLIDLHKQKTSYEEKKLEWIGLAEDFQEYLVSTDVKKKVE